MRDSRMHGRAGPKPAAPPGEVGKEAVMTRATLVLMAALILGPATALAHGPNEHPADPGLHVGDKFSECWVEFSPELTQGAFHKFVREFGSVSAFKSVASPVPMGRWSVAFGIEQSNFVIEE